MSSSPLRPGASQQEELDFYKKAYEQLEADLADFQTASKEVEEQLERDVEAAEKRERKLKEENEKLKYEAEEWKAKYMNAKAESNSAQNALQKEITTLREQNRSLSLKLRDIEVANDDYERQARNTTSSMEDMEAKLNQSIERGVLLEEEVKNGEQEREALRIDTQRVRDDLGDLKVESEIRLEKLRKAEQVIETLRSRKPSPLAVENLRSRSPGSEASGITPSSPGASTPPTKSDTASDAPTPPSPPLSDAPMHAKADPKTPVPVKRTSLLPDPSATPRQHMHSARATTSRHTRGPSMASSSSTATADVKAMKPPARTRPSRPSGLDSLPRSESLYQMKSLRSRMQKIEERVHSARSKLPPTMNTTPRSSPRTQSALSQNRDSSIPASVTVRRTSKRPSGIAVPSTTSDAPQEDAEDSRPPSRSRRESHIKRLSYGVGGGIPRPPSSAAGERPGSSMARERPPSSMGRERPPSSMSMDRPPSRSAASSRPTSRVSLARPDSRTGARTPIGSHFPREIPALNPAGHASSIARPRSSIGGSYGANASTPKPSGPRTLHRPSASISELRRSAIEADDATSGLPAPGGRRTSGLPAPSGKRQSTGAGRRQSVQESMGPPARRKTEMVEEGKDELGETY